MHHLVEIYAADKENGRERDDDQEAQPCGTHAVVHMQGLRGGEWEGEVQQRKDFRKVH